MLPSRLDSKQFGMAVRAERNKLSLTQAQLSERANITNKSIGKIENGLVTASVKTVEKLEKALFGHGESGKDLSSDDLRLSTASVEEILEELNRRGFTNVSLSYN